MKVVPFTRSPGRPARPYVLIDSGRCTGGDNPAHVGRWLFMVSLVDEEGFHFHDYIGESYVEAGEAAIGWACDYGCRIVDRSALEPTT